MRVFLLFTLLLSSSLSLSTPLQGLDDTQQPQAALKGQKSTALEPEKRSVQDIYHAALQEQGTLRVAWGGDGELRRGGHQFRL